MRETLRGREFVCVCMRRGGLLPAEAAVVRSEMYIACGKLPGTQCWAHYTYFVCDQRAIPSN